VKISSRSDLNTEDINNYSVKREVPIRQTIDSRGSSLSSDFYFKYLYIYLVRSSCKSLLRLSKWYVFCWVCWDGM